MGKFIEKLQKTLEGIGVVKSIGPLYDDTRFHKTLRSYMSSAGNETVDDPYQKSVWVYSSIKAIAGNISRVPFRLYNTIGNNKEVVETGPLVSLFENPNPYMTASTLFEATIIFLELYGESFWIIERDNVTQIPKEIWCVSPDRFEPYFESDDRYWRGIWEYNNGREKYLFAPWEVLQFKYFNPYHDVRGLSPIEAAKLGMEQDYFASQYNKNFFKEGAAVGGIISVEDSLTDEQFNRIRGQFEERHKGYTKAHRIAIVEGGAKFNEMKMNQRDMEFISLKTVTRGEILAAFKTNEVVLGNYANIQSYEGIKQAHKSFWEECLLPKMMLIEQLLWSKFFSKVTGGKTWAAFDLGVVEALREDLKVKVEMAEKLAKIGFPINAISKRLELGFEEFEWGNTWWVQFGMAPADDIMHGNISNYQPDPNVGGEPATPGDSQNTPQTDPDKPKPGEPSKSTPTPPDNSIIGRYISKQTPVENLFRNKIKRYFFDQRKRVLNNLYTNTLLFDEELEKKEISNVLSPLYKLAATVGSQLIQEEVGIELDISKEIEIIISNTISKSSVVILNTIRNQLPKVDTESNKTIIADSIREIYNKASNRSSTIARTETNSMINLIRYLYMLHFGITKHKWISRDVGRESHRKYNGKIVKLGESFNTDFVLRFPTDPKAPIKERINCMCITIPIRN